MALTRLGRNIIILVGVAVIGGGGYTAAKHFGMLDHVATPPQYAATPNAPVVQQQLQQASPPPGFQPTADTLKSILSNGVVRISVENPSQPFYNDEGGQISGFNVEFANLLFKDSAFAQAQKPIVIDTKHEVPEYAQVPRQLMANDAQGMPLVDIAMDGLTFPDNTPTGVVYTIPYVTDFGYALIVGPSSSVRSAADLGGKRIGILDGDPDVKAFAQRMYPTATIVPVSDSDPHFIDKSVDGQVVDAFIYDYPFAVASIKGTDLKFAVTKLDGADLSYKIGVRSSDFTLLTYLNSAIAKVKASDAYKALLVKYFVSDQAVTTAASGGERVYTVKQGDTLGKIATSQLGSGGAYRKIQARNNLPNPDLIQVGQHLVIPRA